MPHMLKEWSSVVGALESGEQHVLLRKGGILDTASGFRTESDRFWLYPTWEHQTPGHIREWFGRHLNRERPPEGTNTVSSYAKVLEEADITSDDTMHNMEPFHIWSSKYVEARRDWKPERPMRAVLLRVFVVRPFSIPLRREYAGCRSWLDMDRDAGGGTPVLDDGQASDIVRRFRSAIS